MSVRTVWDSIALSTGAFLSPPLEQQLVAEGEIPPPPLQPPFSPPIPPTAFPLLHFLQGIKKGSIQLVGLPRTYMRKARNEWG